MDKNELDTNLKARISLLDTNKEHARDNDDIIDTSYAKKALETHDIKDAATAIVEARKLTSQLGKLWAQKLEEYFTSYYETNLDQMIATVENDYDTFIRVAINSTKVEDVYAAIMRLQDIKENPAYKRWYYRLNEMLESELGFKYEERPEYLKNIETHVIEAKTTSNLARILAVLETLKQVIETDNESQLRHIYEKWYIEVNDMLNVYTEYSYDEIENVREEIHNPVVDNNVLSLINTLVLKKSREKQDQHVEYNGYVLDTTDCNTLDDMYLKYNNVIEEEYQNVYSKITRLMQSVDSQVEVSDLTESELKMAQDLRRAKYIFAQDRAEYNTEDDFNEEEYNEIMNKSKELDSLLSEKENLDIKDSRQVFYWVQKLVPYINIESITSKEETEVDKYLIKLLNDAEYTSEKVNVTDINSFYKNMLAKEIKELEEYRFFVSEYDNDANERLTSDKVKEIATLNYYKDLYYESVRRLGHIDKKLNSIGELRVEANSEYVDKKKDLESRLENINKKIDSINDLTVVSNVFRTEDTEAKEAYEIAKTTPTLNTLTKMFDSIARLHDRDYKDKMLIAGYSLLDESKDKEIITKKDFQSIEKANKLTYVKRRNINNIIEEKEDLEEDIQELDGKLETAFNEIFETEKVLNDEKAKYENICNNSKTAISDVAASLKEKGYVDRSEEFKNIDIEEEKEGFFDKFKNFFNKNKQDSSITIIKEEDETLKEFVPIRKIKPIKKSLYADVNQLTVKEKISKGMNESIKDIKKHPLVYTMMTFICVDLMITAYDSIKETFDESKKQQSNEPIIEESVISDIEIPYIDEIQEVENIDETLGKMSK